MTYVEEFFKADEGKAFIKKMNEIMKSIEWEDDEKLRRRSDQAEI